MPIYERTRRGYWAVLSVPVLGRVVRRIGDGAKHALRRVVSPSSEPIDVVLADQIRAGGSLQASLEGLRGELRRDVTTIMTMLGEMREAEAHERGLREALADGQRIVAAELQQLAARDAEIQEALGREGTRARLSEDELRRRVEFVRQETLFELQVSTHAEPGQSAVVGEPEIVNRQKFEAMRTAGTVRLNVGCGHLAIDDYLNIDARRLPGVDIVAEAAGLPLAPASVDEIYCSHLLEHFPLETLRRIILPTWAGLLKPGGVLRAVVPDAEAMLSAHAAGEMSFDDLREVMFGLQEYAGDFHYAMFTPGYLGTLLGEAGLGDVAYAFTGRRNGKCFDMEVRATKPAS